MSENLLGKRKIKSHKEYRPIDSVETQNILTYHVHVTRPIFFEMLGLLLVRLVGIVAKSCNIVCKRVKPYVNNVSIVKVNRNSPLKGATRNAKVLQACFKEVVYHFLFSRLGLNKLGVVLDMFHESVGILAHFEEICFLLSLLNRSATVGTLAVTYLCFRKE